MKLLQVLKCSFDREKVKQPSLVSFKSILNQTITFARSDRHEDKELDRDLFKKFSCKFHPVFKSQSEL